MSLAPKKLYLAKIAPEKEILDFSITSLNEFDEEFDSEEMQLQRPDALFMDFQVPARERNLIRTTTTTTALIIFTENALNQKIESCLK